MIILIGTDHALLEGLAQLLAGAGHRVSVASSLDEAEDISDERAPLMLVVDRRALASDGDRRLSRLPLAAGGAIVLYRTAGDDGRSSALSHGVARLTLADLNLPLERQRLAALAQYVRTRARESGRGRVDTPPESHAS